MRLHWHFTMKIGLMAPFQWYFWFLIFLLKFFTFACKALVILLKVKIEAHFEGQHCRSSDQCFYPSKWSIELNKNLFFVLEVKITMKCKVILKNIGHYYTLNYFILLIFSFLRRWSYLRRAIKHYPQIREMLAQASRCAVCGESFLNTWLECVKFVDAKSVSSFFLHFHDMIGNDIYCGIFMHPL